jgi:hypothetical protein
MIIALYYFAQFAHSENEARRRQRKTVHKKKKKKNQHKKSINAAVYVFASRHSLIEN